jgi:hypothetical protein
MSTLVNQPNRNARDAIRLAFCIGLSLCIFAGIARCETIQVSIDPTHPGTSISSHMLRLSYETSLLMPDANASHYFRPDNKPLVNLFQTLGIKSLRIGGSSVDDPANSIPTDSDIDSLFGFAKAADVKVIYSVRLKSGDSQSAAHIAKYIEDHFADHLDSFAIGNEPASFGGGYNYASFKKEWPVIMQAIVDAAPDAKFSGPDVNPNAKWTKQFVQDFRSTGRLTDLTVHLYAGGCSYRHPQDYKNPMPYDAAETREKMLSGSWEHTYQKVFDGITESLAGTSIPFRLSETNSLWASGLAGVSDSYASALWSADYLHWWAAHGADGLNFHTGDKTGGGTNPRVARYAAFVTAGNGYDVHPLAYGMKLFGLGGVGRSIPLTMTGNDKANLTSYGTVDDHVIYVTLIRRGHGSDAADVQLNLPSSSLASDASEIFLRSPGDDVAAMAGQTIGGKPIAQDGSWAGKWMPISVVDPANRIDFKMPPASAVVVKITLR